LRIVQAAVGADQGTGMDVANRASDHSRQVDPIVRSPIDTGFCKLLMGQFVFEPSPAARALSGSEPPA
jgi:hypothetical protein